MDPNRAAELKKAMSDFGVPENVADYVTKSEIDSWLNTATAILMIFVIFLGFGVVFLIFRKLEGITESNALKHAENTNGILYDYNFGFSMLILLFAWIFVSGALAGILTVLSHRNMVSTFAGTFGEAKKSRTSRWILRWEIKRSPSNIDPATYIRKLIINREIVIAISAIVLLIIAVLAAVRDIQTNSVFTRDAYVRSPFFPWGSREPHKWASAVSVGTGCNYAARDRSNTIIYEVTFADGESVRIGGSIPLKGSWLDAAETIDRELRASGATFAPWKWLNRDSFHPRCIEAFQDALWDSEFERLKRLLRLPDGEY